MLDQPGGLIDGHGQAISATRSAGVGCGPRTTRPGISPVGFPSR
jgi:hypothetical protein